MRPQALRAQDVLCGSDVPLGHIDDVDVVPDAGAVRGGVGVAEDAQLGAAADGDLKYVEQT